MSGITRKNQAGVSGLVGPAVDFQRFTSSATWTKPDNVSVVWIECIGGGGGGAGGEGANNVRDGGGGGGGGGAFAWACFSADALPATLDVVVGDEANGGGGGNGAAGSNGVAGNHSQVDIPSGETEAGKVILKAFGGGHGDGAGEGDVGGSGGGGAAQVAQGQMLLRITQPMLVATLRFKAHLMAIL